MRSPRSPWFALGAVVLVTAVLLVALFANREDRGTEGGEGVFPSTLPRPDEPRTSGSLEPAKPRIEVDEFEPADRAPIADPRDAAARMSYTLLDPAGTPVIGARVALCFEGRCLLEDSTDERGVFSGEAQGTGEGKLLVLAPRFAPRILEVPVEAGEHVVQLDRGAVVSGWVVIDGTSPSESIPLLVQAASPLLRDEEVANRSWGGLAVEARSMTGIPCRTAADGAFRVQGLPDDWRGSIDLPREYRLMDATKAAGHWDPHRLILDAPRENVIVELSTGARVYGREADGDPGAYILHDLPDEELTVQVYVNGTSYRRVHHPADPELIVVVP